jgi:hypothetical protein
MERFFASTIFSTHLPLRVWIDGAGAHVPSSMTELAGRGGIGGTGTFNHGEAHIHNKKYILCLFF